MENITVNEKKVKDIEVDGKTYERYAIKTHVRVEFYSSLVKRKSLMPESL